MHPSIFYVEPRSRFLVFDDTTKAIIRTKTSFVDLLKPSFEKICAEDFCHGLSNICRFTGAGRFYSVAEHSIAVGLVCDFLGGSFKEGLLHDCSEAYLGDVSSPLKKLIDNYSSIENSWQKCIYYKYTPEFTLESTNLVKKADRLLLNMERKSLFPNDSDEFWPETSDLPDIGCELLKDLSHGVLGNFNLSPEKSENLMLKICLLNNIR
jgi:hypothetical protein